jgi:hypothetical protein
MKQDLQILATEQEESTVVKFIKHLQSWSLNTCNISSKLNYSSKFNTSLKIPYHEFPFITQNYLF